MLGRVGPSYRCAGPSTLTTGGLSVIVGALPRALKGAILRGHARVGEDCAEGGAGDIIGQS